MSVKPDDNPRLSTATGMNVITFSTVEGIRPVIKSQQKMIPGIGNSVAVDTEYATECPVECKYCFQRLKNTKAKYGRVSERVFGNIVKALNTLRPEVINCGEKIEVGAYPSALASLVRLRKEIHPDIQMILTTKFPEKVVPAFAKVTHNKNVKILTTMSNQREIKNLEPGAPSFEARKNSIKRLSEKYSNVDLGVRCLIMQKQDIIPMAGAIEEMVPFLGDNLVWIDFLRAQRSNGVFREGFVRALSPYLDMDQFIFYAKGCFTLKPYILERCVSALEKFDPIYDRPVAAASQHFHIFNNVRTIHLSQEPQCYIRADSPLCIGGAQSKGCTTCPGVINPKNTGFTKGCLARCTDNICNNLLNLTPEQFMSTRGLWMWVFRKKLFAYGRPERSIPLLTTQKILKLLFYDGLPQRYNVSQMRILTAPDGRTLDLSKVK